MTAILIDGSNTTYKYGWVHRHLKSSDGRKTGVAYGLIGLLLRLKRRYPDARFAVAWDGPERDHSWRHKLYTGYKRNRSGPKPGEIQAALSQIPLVDEMLKLIGVPTIRATEIEADDVIGILATQCIELGWETVIYSSDKDFMQLMTKGVKLIRDTDKDRRLSCETQASVLNEFRCDLRDLLKVRALAGDKSDNIPGIQFGIGPVKAAQLIQGGFTIETNPTAARNYRLMKIVTSVEFSLFSMKARENLRPQIEAVMDVLTTGTRSARLAAVAEFFGDLSMIEAVGNRHAIVELMS
jgi:DNA polymerase-1